MSSPSSDGPEPIRASICMATYNGSAFVEQQIESILSQLGSSDELVIVDDASTDETRQVIRGLSDPRISLIEPAVNQGYVRSFEQAVLASRGAYIFLADQDDIWIEGRLERMLDALAQDLVVATNFDVLGGGPRPSIPPLHSGDSGRHGANLLGILIGYRAYYGCGMAFRREFIGMFAPVPPYLRESHDLWTAICGNILGSIRHLDSPTLLRRIHGENVTPRGWRSLSVILRARIILLRLVVEAIRRKAQWRRAIRTP